ncbi:MAG: hypothetical protein HY043_24135 [Verrucomicrobia bacterium]|nr:hypothetical protein [Verrucomicrobiota bacterium]
MKPDEFEKNLERQGLRKIPNAWREQILRAALVAAEQNSPRPSPLASRRSVWWRELLWPCPQVWAGLATVWVFIVLMNFGLAEKSSSGVAVAPPPSKEVLLALREQRRALERALEPDEPAAEPPKRFFPRPRSEGNPRVATG